MLKRKAYHYYVKRKKLTISTLNKEEKSLLQHYTKKKTEKACHYNQ